MSQDSSMPLSDLVHHIRQIEHIATLITPRQYTHGIYATEDQPFTSQLVDANMMLISVPITDLIHHIHQIQHIATLVLSQYVHDVYNTQPFLSQPGDVNVMSTSGQSDPCVVQVVWLCK